MKEETVVGLEMGKEELEELLKNLPQILKELEQYITDHNSYSL
jgi:prefoldin subunit 5